MTHDPVPPALWAYVATQIRLALEREWRTQPSPVTPPTGFGYVMTTPRGTILINQTRKS